MNVQTKLSDNVSLYCRKSHHLNIKYDTYSRYVYWQDHGRVRGRRGMLIIFAFYENSSVLSSSTKVSLPMFPYTRTYFDVISDFIVEYHIYRRK